MKITPHVLGLDLGDRRTGVALSDAIGIAQPLLTMGAASEKVIAKNIARLVRRYQAVALVVGSPLHLSGDLSRQAVKARAFAAALRATLPIPVYLQDERLSSVAAHERMDRLGFARGPDRKAKLDQYAAVVILQDWLDARERLAELEAEGTPDARSL